MSHNSKRVAVFATAACAVLSVLVVGLLGLRAGAVEAQGVMSAPACQCSAVTEVPGLSTRLAHCMCGGMACVVSRHAAAGSENLMQCVK